MARFLIFLALVLGLGWAFAWLADRPGDLVLTFSGMRYELSLTTALAGFLAAVAIIMIVWWTVRTLLDSPQLVRRWFRARRRDRGYQALSTGLIAAGAGNAAMARKLSERAAGFISGDQEPLLPYLDAQVALLEGRNDDARSAFETMSASEETRALGLRGLYLEAERLGDSVAARHHAEKALETSPLLGWASDAVLAGRTRDGDFDKALALLDERKRLKNTGTADPARLRAVLLTAKAMAALDHDPTGARNAAIEANKLAPELVPAAVTAAKALFRNDELKKGVRILEAAWKAGPHPDIADAYVHARSGDSAQDRLARAQALDRLTPGHPEALMALAQAQHGASEHAKARKTIEALLKSAPRESAWLLLADIEEAETGNQGRVREWLQRAVKAPRDAAWMADGQTSPRWLPFSPISNRIDAFTWAAPAPLIGSAEAVIDADALGLILQPASEASPVPPVAEAPQSVVTANAAADAPAETSPPDAESVLRHAGFDAGPTPNPAKTKPGFRLF
jgi:HemY protein